MQQHSGQHILSQAFVRTAEAETVGFHLSETIATLDLDRPDVSEAEVATAEALANETVWRNLPITASLVDWARLEEFPLRKRPPKDYAQLRLVAIGDFDLSACGGTHVAHTGEVGLIKVVKREKRGDKTRLEFMCGGRAVADYGRHLALVGGLVGELTTAAEELLPNIQKLRGENKLLQRQLKSVQEQLLGLEAQALASQFVPTATGGAVLAAVLPHKTPADLRQLANGLTASAGRVVLLATLGADGQTPFLLFRRHEEAGGDMAALLKTAVAEWGGTGGGGTAVQAQGGGMAATAEEVTAVLNRLSQSNLG
jgi:alanyl-tRNA synthetase